jgi:hypothetical protein
VPEVAFRFASIGLGAGLYYTPPGNGGSLSFLASTIAYDPAADTLRITLGAMNNPGTVNKVSAGSAVPLNLSSGILDAGDNSLIGYTSSSASGPQF